MVDPPVLSNHLPPPGPLLKKEGTFQRPLAALSLYVIFLGIGPHDFVPLWFNSQPMLLQTSIKGASAEP